VSGSPGLGVLAALGVTLGLCALATWLLRRFAPGTLAPRAAVTLRVLQRVALGPKQGVAVLQAGERVLLVAMTDGGASLLAELDGEDRARVLAAAVPAPAAAATKELRSFLSAVTRGVKRGAGLAALVLALAWAAPAAAQHVTVPPPVKGPVTKVAPASPPRVTHPIPGPVVNPPPMPQVDIRIGEGKGAVHLSGAVGLVVFLGAMTLLPALFLLMTSFTRILIVLHFLRSALGTQTSPPGQLLTALAVLLTGMVMHPVLEETNRVALQPYLSGQVEQVEAYRLALQPFRAFMLRNVREQDLAAFAEMSGIESVQSDDELPTVTVVSAFVVSELRTAFQMGFVIYLPFVVVDVIVASVLMSLGMFMLPPVMISMPLKLLLFVLADGWTLVVQNLVRSFQ
jgi:flagellar biosynthetic protein FliP